MRAICRVPAATIVLLVTGGNIASAQAAHPHFAGQWVLDPSRNVVTGPTAAASAATASVVEHGDTITIDRQTTHDREIFRTHLRYGVDGKPWVNTIPVNGEETRASSVLSWDRATLVIRTTFAMHGRTVDQMERWTLSADGKTWLIGREISAEGQETASTSSTYVKRP